MNAYIKQILANHQGGLNSDVTNPITTYIHKKKNGGGKGKLAELTKLLVAR